MDVAIVVINFLYALVGACFTIAFMALGFKVFDRMTPFDTHDELAKGNIAVGSWSGRSSWALASPSVWSSGWG